MPLVRPLIKLLFAARVTAAWEGLGVGFKKAGCSAVPIALAAGAAAKADGITVSIAGDTGVKKGDTMEALPCQGVLGIKGVTVGIVGLNASPKQGLRAAAANEGGANVREGIKNLNKGVVVVTKLKNKSC